MSLDDFVRDTDEWKEPETEDYKAVDTDALRPLAMAEIPELDPREAEERYAQIVETARWFVAFEPDGYDTRRRRWAQHRVAEREDVEFDEVQQKVRDAYENRSGRHGAQELFEDALVRIEEDYQGKLEEC